MELDIEWWIEFYRQTVGMWVRAIETKVFRSVCTFVLSYHPVVKNDASIPYIYKFTEFNEQFLNSASTWASTFCPDFSFRLCFVIHFCRGWWRIRV
jgi:hypothetical protein